MNHEVIKEKVRTFLIEDLEIEECAITDSALLKEDLKIDSLDFVDIVVIVERDFGFKLFPEDLKGVRTVEDFCNFIDKKVNHCG